MQTVLFFARIREQLGESQLHCAPVDNIDALIEQLAIRGAHWGGNIARAECDRRGESGGRRSHPAAARWR